MSDRFHFALLGCGAIAPTHVEALQALDAEGIGVVACCDEVPERAAEIALKYQVEARDWDEVLADPNIHAISICTPSGLHGEHAVQALRAGKHAIVEKPMEVSLAACDRMREAAREAGRNLAVVSQHRFDPASLYVKNAIATGRLGTLIAVEVRVPWYRTQEYYDSGNWRGTWEMDGGGCLMNQGVHTVDLMRWLCGPLTSVNAHMRTAAHQRIEVEDLIVATLKFESGAIGTLIASTAFYPGFPASIAVYGTNGSAVIEGDQLKTFTVLGEQALPSQAATAHAVQVATGGTRSAVANSVPLAGAQAAEWVWGDAHRAQLLDFVRACRGASSEPLVNAMEGRNAVETVLALYHSARTGSRVNLPVDTASIR